MHDTHTANSRAENCTKKFANLKTKDIDRDRAVLIFLVILTNPNCFHTTLGAKVGIATVTATM
jgi:hypothetical protein